MNITIRTTISPPHTKQSSKSISPKPPSTYDSDVKVRKRVRKACSRCRIKKTKCDGSSPCLRCQTDNVICCAKDSQKVRHRNFPQGYAEMLERQQAQLVSCVQQLYQRLRTAGLWEHSLTEESNRPPLTHDILAALDLLELNDDGSGEPETFKDVIGSSQSDDGTTLTALVDVTEAAQDRHDSITDQTESPSLPGGNTTLFFPGVFTFEELPEAASESLSPPDQTFEKSPKHLRQDSTQTKTTRTPSIETATKSNMSQAQPFASLAAKRIHQTSQDTSEVSPYSRTLTHPLFMDMPVIRPEFLSNQSTTASSMQLTFSHEWARSGIMLDSSDFATDFCRLSQLDSGCADAGLSGLGLTIS